jgi:hypothetical protein
MLISYDRMAVAHAAANALETMVKGEVKGGGEDQF